MRPSDHFLASPSPWVTRFLRLIPQPGPVLDLACGRGRHVRLLRANNYHVIAVDRDIEGLAAFSDDDDVEIVAADLEGPGPEERASWPLANRSFGGIVVTNYLHRPLFSSMIAALSPNGVLIYETFAAGNQRYGKPSNPDFLLCTGELLEAFCPALQIVAYEHGKIAGPRPRVVQRICAIKTSPGAEKAKAVARIG
jgi:SAM-dependent methyltransferase